MNLLNRRDRGILACAIMLCAAAVLAAFVLQNLAGNPAWATYAANGILITIAVVAGLAGLALSRFDPCASDLMNAAYAEMDREDRIARAWRDHKVVQSAFREMDWKSKAMFLMCLLGGASLLVYAAADALGFIANPLLVPGPNHTLVPVPRWISALAEAIFGVMFLLMTNIARIDIRESLDDEWKALLRRWKDDGLIH